MVFAEDRLSVLIGRKRFYNTTRFLIRFYELRKNESIPVDENLTKKISFGWG
jgi:hypothetical protein